MKKLQISRETLRALANSDLDEVVGGVSLICTKVQTACVKCPPTFVVTACGTSARCTF